MNPIRTIIISLIMLLIVSCSKENIVDRNLQIAEDHYSKMIVAIGKTNKSPRTVDKNGNVVLVNSRDWTSGFFPGSLWYLYEFSVATVSYWSSPAKMDPLYIQKMINGNRKRSFIQRISRGNSLTIPHTI